MRAKVPIPKIDEVKKWLWLRKRVICAALTFTATIMLALLSIDPNSKEAERALYILLALVAFSASIWLWLKQIEFVDEYVEEYEFITFPIEKEEPIEEGGELEAVNLKSAPEPPAQPEPPKQRANIKPWCPYCGSVRIIVRDKRIYCLDCGQIARAEKVKGA
ncbi:MAG: hypothetical protein LM576_01740 [Thermofilum sp.]|nr:hypothetical protein [Thermofilum sp.]